MTPDIEKAAQALRRGINDAGGIFDMTDDDISVLVIEALLEPSEAMVEAAAKMLTPDWNEAWPALRDRARVAARAALHAGIAAALGRKL